MSSVSALLVRLGAFGLSCDSQATDGAKLRSETLNMGQQDYENRKKVHQSRAGRIRGTGLRDDQFGNPQSGRHNSVQAGQCGSSVKLEPGGQRRDRAKVFPQGWRAP